MDFADWLFKELINRDMTQAELVRLSGLSTALVSRILSRKRGVGSKACKSIARALDMPEEIIYRKAGLLSGSEEPHALAELIQLYLSANREEREIMLGLARELSRRSGKQVYEKTDGRKL